MVGRWAWVGVGEQARTSLIAFGPCRCSAERRRAWQGSGTNRSAACLPHHSRRPPSPPASPRLAQTMRPTASLAVTIPTRLAQASRVSSSREEARTRALALYRNYYRSVPEICALYALDVPPSTLRAKYREMFERNRHIDDLAVIDIMLHKGQVEFQETINAWKQIPHIMKLFAEEEVRAGKQGGVRRGPIADTLLSYALSLPVNRHLVSREGSVKLRCVWDAHSPFRRSATRHIP